MPLLLPPHNTHSCVEFQAVKSQVHTMCNGFVISDLNIEPSMSTITSKLIAKMDQERIQGKKIENYGKYQAKRAWKMDEDEEDYEADFQVFLNESNEEDNKHHKFIELMDVSRLGKGKLGPNLLKKGKDLLTNSCTSMHH